MKLGSAWRLARLLLVPKGALKIATAHEHHMIAEFRDAYDRDPTDEELRLMAFGFVAVIKGLT